MLCLLTHQPGRTVPFQMVVMSGKCRQMLRVALLCSFHLLGVPYLAKKLRRCKECRDCFTYVFDYDSNTCPAYELP